jgi:predicted TIM-barrel fold metal-dependent hydrolase
VRPAPVAGYRTSRSPFLPEFDPFWQKVEESGVLVTLHASDSGYMRYLNTWEGKADGEFTYTNPTPFPYVADGGRTIHDTLASAICHGTLTRFPGLRLMSVENGGSWVGNFVKQLQVTKKKMPNAFAEDPIEVLHRNVWINPFWEDDLGGLIDLVGVDRVCFGSDFPHAEGLADPVSFVAELAGQPADDIARIMGGNVLELVPTGASAR